MIAVTKLHQRPPSGTRGMQRFAPAGHARGSFHPVRARRATAAHWHSLCSTSRSHVPGEGYPHPKIQRGVRGGAAKRTCV
jgi:hypothetical protein